MMLIYTLHVKAELHPFLINLHWVFNYSFLGVPKSAVHNFSLVSKFLWTYFETN